MENLTEQVKRTYAAEVRSIRNAGSDSWVYGIGVGIAVVGLGGYFVFFNKPWKGSEILFGVVSAIVFPFAVRAWARHKVAAEMRHEREVRMEVMLDALLERVRYRNINEG